jgi:methylase of polypeptide subunit release factors
MMSADLLKLDALGSTGRFDDLLQLLRSTNYSDEFICKRLKLGHAEEFELDRKKRPPLPKPESAADVLLTLFLAGELVSPSLMDQLLGAKNISLLEGMGLLQKTADPDRYYATLALYPFEDLFIASDRWSTPDGARLAGPEDTVYPAFIPNTRLFIRHLPERPGAKILDLCGGTGIAALRAARKGAVRAWSSDIADRSTRFAEFNRRLNGISNAQMVTGDLYKNLEGLRFDVISAHPPYVPTLQSKWIFASGGTDGEEITKSIIEGLPDHLDTDGCFIALTMGSDRVGRPLEHRIREWLGPNHAEFDIALLVRKELDPQTFALRANRDTIRTREEAELWNQLFTKLRVQSMCYGFICIQRSSGEHRPFTIRRQASSLAVRSPWEWLLRWESAVHGDQLPKLILDSPLHASRGTDFEVRHRLEQGFWNPSKYTLKTQYPFSMECDAQPWMAHLISLCDGRATGRDLLNRLVQNAVLPPSAPETEYAEAVASLISGGFIGLEGFRPPPQ